MKKVVIALGGNAILQSGQAATYENQLNNVKKSCVVIADLIEAGNEVLVTHGNGPQVGNILRQNEVAKDIVAPLPLDVCNAMSQGFIGYMIETSLRNELQRRGLNKEIVGLFTSVEVDPQDPAFKNPTKPIGKFYTEEEAKQLEKEMGWIVRKDANRGWRRVVPSPLPKRINGANNMKNFLTCGKVVVASGGGGIPVIRNQAGELQGIEAVIDKDHSGSKLAREIDADIFMILTDVEHVSIHFGEPNETALHSMTPEEANKYLLEGHFSTGSMEPKVRAAIEFANTGKPAIICSIQQATKALLGKTGTWIQLENGVVNN